MTECQVSSNPLRILMAACVPRRREGGVAATVYGFGAELEKLGHKLTYIFQDDLTDLTLTNRRFSELIFAHRLGQYIVKNCGDFSIVNLHAPAGFLYGLRRRWFGDRDLPPYVMMLHGLEERRVQVMRREADKGRAWHFSLKNRLWHSVYVFPRFRCSIGTADGAHSNSRDVWNLLQLKYNLDPARTIYTPSGVEPRFFVSRTYNQDGSAKLLYVGSWLDQRGIFYLRDALERLVSRLPGLVMTFAGCGCPAEVIKDFFGPKVAPHVIVYPTVPAGEIHQLFSAHEIFLFPSLLEGLPTVLLEAMASGMAVITTETCGMPDVVEDGFNGVLIPPADASAIEEAVLRLASSPDLRCRLGRAAQQTMSRFTWERSAIKIEKLFRDVIAAEGRRSSA